MGSTVCKLKTYRENGIRRSQLASRWTELSDDEFAWCGSYIQALKRGTPGVGSTIDGGPLQRPLTDQSDPGQRNALRRNVAMVIVNKGKSRQAIVNNWF
jgi:hypothetical protein